MNDTELKIKGLEVLRKNLGLVEMEKFIFLMRRENFDYTAWRKNLFIGLSGEDISQMAMKTRQATEGRKNKK